MSFFASSAASNSSFAAISFAFSSRTSEPNQMMRSFSSRSNTLGVSVSSAILELPMLRSAFPRIYPGPPTLAETVRHGRTRCRGRSQHEPDVAQQVHEPDVAQQVHEPDVAQQVHESGRYRV